MTEQNQTQTSQNDYPEELKNRAREFFRKGSEVAYALQYDYAIELYLDGLSFWPSALEEGHKPLREIALRRQAAGGKKSGFADGSKYKKGSGKHAKDAMLKAEYLLSKDPANQGHMADMIKAAVECECRQTAHWMADILFDTNLQNEKPVLQHYVFLKETYAKLREFQRAAQACQMALQLKPKDDGLMDALRDLSARAALQKGKYEEEGDFRESIKDREVQDRLHSQEQFIRSQDHVEKEIEDARKEYEQNSQDSSKIDKLVRALCDTEKAPNEKEAIEILEKAYKDSGEFSYRQRSGEIKIRQLKRNARRVKAKLKKDPKDTELNQKLNQLAAQMLQQELEHYHQCVDNYPTDRRLKYEYARCQMRARHYDEAIPLLQEARGDPKLRVAALNSIGTCFYHKKWYPDAVESFQQALELLDNKEDNVGKELMYNLGRAYEAEGNIEEALNHYRRVAQIDFNYADARQRVDQLRQAQRGPDQQ